MKAKEVKRIRKELGWSQSKFAERIGASVRAVRGWEIGETTPLPLFQKAIAKLAKQNGVAA